MPNNISFDDNAKFIMEGAIFQEAEVVKKYPNKAIFRSTVQTADEVNSNRRFYPKSVLEEGIVFYLNILIN